MPTILLNFSFKIFNKVLTGKLIIVVGRVIKNPCLLVYYIALSRYAPPTGSPFRAGGCHLDLSSFDIELQCCNLHGIRNSNLTLGLTVDLRNLNLATPKDE
jgi:hypothetical protein